MGNVYGCMLCMLSDPWTALLFRATACLVCHLMLAIAGKL
jgi:hypothetical protein